MKQLFRVAISFLLTALLISSCKSNKEENITPEEKEVIRKEIAARIETVSKGVEQHNVDAAIVPYLNAPEFRIVTPDGRITDYAAMKSEQAAFFKDAASVSFTTAKEDLLFLSKTLVLCTWTGRNEFTMNSGERYKIEPYTGSMLFSKINNEWKIIYAHESGGPPARQ